LDLGHAEADIALSLSTESADAHRAKAGVFFMSGQPSEALEEEMQTIEKGGLEERITYFVADTLNTLGRPHNALRWCQLALPSSRTPGVADRIMGDCWSALGDDERAIQAYYRAAELVPLSSCGIIGISHARLLTGNFAQAREILGKEEQGDQNEPTEKAQMFAQIEFFARKFKEAERLYNYLVRSDADGGGSFYGAVSYASALGRIKQELGDSEGAKVLLTNCLAKRAALAAREPCNPDSVISLAAIEASLGMSGAALDHLREGVTLGWIDYRSLKLDPRFDSIRSSPEFATVINNLSVKVADMRLTAQSNH
jgi:tetratricopeptide (TPR) repeat protein